MVPLTQNSLRRRVLACLHGTASYLYPLGKYGKGKRGDAMPEELARRENRLEKIREAKVALGREAKERAEEEKAKVEAQLKACEKQERKRGRKSSG
jgi:hypothetical protein